STKSRERIRPASDRNSSCCALLNPNCGSACPPTRPPGSITTCRTQSSAKTTKPPQACAIAWRSPATGRRLRSCALCLNAVAAYFRRMLDAIPRRAFLRFEFPLLYRAKIPHLTGSLDSWPHEFELPDLVRLEQRPAIARVMGAWNDDGLTVAYEIARRSGPLK